MTVTFTRRGFVLGGAAMLAAPAIVHAQTREIVVGGNGFGPSICTPIVMCRRRMR